MTKEINKTNYKYLIYILALWAVSVYSGMAGDVVHSMIMAGIGGGFFAAVCRMNFKAWTALLMTLIPPAGVYYMTGEVNNVILSLSFLPVGIALFWGMEKKLSRSQTVARSIFAMVLFYAIVYANHVYSLFGKINGENIVKYIELNLHSVRLYMEYVKNLYIQMEIDVEELFSTAEIEALIDVLKVSWLGCGLAIFGVSSYIGTVIAKRSSNFKIENKNGSDSWAFVLSKMGAVVFLLAYLAGGLYSPETEGLYFPLAINGICFGMAPAILYMGIVKVFQKFRTSGRIFVLIVAMIALSFGKFALLLLLIIGVYSALTYKTVAPAETNNDEKKNS